MRSPGFEASGNSDQDVMLRNCETLKLKIKLKHTANIHFHCSINNSPENPRKMKHRIRVSGALHTNRAIFTRCWNDGLMFDCFAHHHEIYDYISGTLIRNTSSF